MDKQAVIVTGTSSGIGLETALFLAERGFEVYATMRDLTASGDLKAKTAKRNTRLYYLQMDVTDRSSIQNAVKTVIAQSGGIYGLVNNAGINIRGFFEDLSEEEMRQVLEVNVFGTMAVTRTVLPYMRAARRGRIVIMSSVGGKIPSLGNAAYCSSKFALEGFGLTLAQEIAPFGLSVSLVEPGFVRTELFGRNRYAAERARDPGSPYYGWFLQMEKLTDKLANSPIASPADVAKTVYDALTAERPRLTYIVGRRAKALISLQRYLPGELFERMWIREAVRRIQRPGTSSNGKAHLTGSKDIDPPNVEVGKKQPVV